MALVTGGAGFVGTNLAHRLACDGHRVRVLDNLSRPGVERNLRWLRDRHPERVEVHVADVRDPLAVGRAVEVRGVLAILCDDWTIKQRPAEVYVDATRGVKDWMLRQPVVLRSHEVIELARAASNPDTWGRGLSS